MLHWTSVVFGTLCGLLFREWFSALDRRALLADLRQERARNERLVERLEATRKWAERIAKKGKR